MRFNYFQHLLHSFLVTAIAVILSGAFGHIVGHLDGGVVVGFSIGACYFAFGVGAGLYYRRKYRMADRRVSRMAEESLEEMMNHIRAGDETTQAEKDA